MLSALLPVRPNERRDTFAAFLTLFAAMAGHAVLETARDALFLARVSVERLPLVYLGLALLALTATALQERFGRRAGGRVLLSGLLALSAVVTAGLWHAIGGGHSRWLYVLYAWTGLAGTLFVVRFWLVLEERLTVTQAKRLFAVIGAGSISGALTGSALARLVASMGPTANLLPAAALLLLAAAVGPLLLSPARPPAEDRGKARDSGEPGFLDGLALTVGRPYLRRIAGLVVVSTVALTLADFLFKSLVVASVPRADLGMFFSGVYFGLNGLSLLAQLVVAGPVLRRFGVSRALALLPLALLAGGAGLTLGGGLLAAVLLKAADGGLRHSVHRTALEVLYVPVAGRERGRVKSVIDVLGLRGGQALASLLILGAIGAGLPRPGLAAIIVFLAAAWLYLADGIQAHYLELFRRTLPEDALRLRDAPEAALDVASLESLVGALSSPDDAVVLAALDILERRGKARFVPLLILYHPSDRVVLRALELFVEARREDLWPMGRRLLRYASAEVRAAALRALPAEEAGDAFEAALADASPLVRATALVGLAAAGGAGAGPALEEIRDIARRGGDDLKLAVSRALQHRGGPMFTEVLLDLVSGPDPKLRRETVHAMRHAPDPRFVPPLVCLLAQRELRRGARAALIAHGPEAVETVGRLLADTGLPPRVRRQIPRALKRLRPSGRAAELLLARFGEEPDGIVRYKILRALGSMRRADPGLPLDAALLRSAVEGTLRVVFQLLNWRLDLERGAREAASRRTEVHETIVSLLREKEEQAIERVFRLLGLLHAGEPVHRIYRGLRSADPRQRASGLELLENLLEPGLREPVLGLLDGADDSRRLLACGPFHAPSSSLYSYVLYQLLQRGGPSLRALTAWHIGELGLGDMRRDLRAIQSGAPPLLAAAIRRALGMLDGPAASEVTPG